MPDTFRYTSVSVSKKAHADLTKLQAQLRKEHGVDFSIAKVIESIAVKEVNKYGQQ
tara:strand:- start:405 stop:572 length:168 start_codon:yes stop_codon:yes gene_type:complete